ncbi:MAG: dihydropteroate synthase, partial [Bacteroidota bacterium]
MIFPQTTLNCAGTLLDLSVPQVMGIINLTPDSFYAGSRKQGTANALATAEQMLQEGAAILDLGGMSSRPGAEIISVEE